MKILLATLLAVMVAGVACAATPPERLRGTLQTVTAGSVILNTTAGTSLTVSLTPETGYALASKSSVSAILPNSYIGTAAKGAGADMVALEVVIFPPAMRGAGEGHYAWDPLPDITKPDITKPGITKPGTNSPSSPSSMSNGSVASVAITPKTSSSMTNGNVQTVSTLPGSKQISVVYKGGKQIIMVLPDTPVVAIQHASAGALAPGVHVVIFASSAGGKITAIRIIAGAAGITPPM